MIGISLGDITGIGPEVTLKALDLVLDSGTDAPQFLLIGDPEHTRRLHRQLGSKFSLRSYADRDEAGKVFLLDTPGAVLPADLPAGAPEAARAAVAWLREGAE